ncbi:kinase-like domain-containing protein [Epithele typhae]|uniref:kinase-like domain-containing protein n=1 Tax=Epithele typhae TaxID=378194 RepID=UPI0020075FE7|nr:kinase-like domain-containing protein [Epithele typhae]KAH9930527.1 kinase-like domain-containing protein [Epithele typhae]
MDNHGSWDLDEDDIEPTGLPFQQPQIEWREVEAFLPADAYPIFHPSDADVAHILALMDTTAVELELAPGEPVASASGNQFADLRDGRVVKVGWRASELMLEAYALVLVRARTRVPVPRVHAAFVRDDAAHLVMDRVDGLPLHRAWASPGGGADRHAQLPRPALRAVLRQLQGAMDQLRALGERLAAQAGGAARGRTAPMRPAFGSWPRQPYAHAAFVDERAPAGLQAPSLVFASLAEFHAYWLARFGRHAADPAYADLRALWARSEGGSAALPELMHGDLAPRNVLVKDGAVVAILDWGTFGWYPTFWQMIGMWAQFKPKRVEDAIKEVFGGPSREASVYVELLALLDNPSFVEDE